MEKRAEAAGHPRSLARVRAHRTKKKTTRRRNDPGLIVAAAVSSVATLVLAGLVAFYACRRPAGRDLEGPVEIKTPPHEETKHSA